MYHRLALAVRQKDRGIPVWRCKLSPSQNSFREWVPTLQKIVKCKKRETEKKKDKNICCPYKKLALRKVRVSNTSLPNNLKDEDTENLLHLPFYYEIFAKESNFRRLEGKTVLWTGNHNIEQRRTSNIHPVSRPHSWRQWGNSTRLGAWYSRHHGPHPTPQHNTPPVFLQGVRAVLQQLAPP